MLAAMNVSIARCSLWLLGALLASATPARAQVEEIYIARSVRDSRVDPTDFCALARTGFTPIYEDRYSFRSTSTRPSDGLVTSADLETIAIGHACVGQKTDPTLFAFYMELQLGRTAVTWNGECTQSKSDFPEKGIGVMHCVLNLVNSDRAYEGGQLTTNTVTSRNVLGTVTDPPGYTQASIATIRLWKRPKY
jgi:hypothetical protein